MGHEADRMRQRREEMLAAQQQFAKAVQSGAIPPLDRFGNPITPGCSVLFRAPVDLQFTVVEVTPILDPRAQMGQVRVVLEGKFPVPLLAGMPSPLFLVLAVAQEEQEAPPQGVKEGTLEGENAPPANSQAGAVPQSDAAPPGGAKLVDLHKLVDRHGRPLRFPPQQGSPDEENQP